jgi:hypothetical protein
LFFLFSMKSNGMKSVRYAAEAASRSVWPILYTPESLITILVCRSSYYRFCLKSPNVSGVDFSEYWSFYISC